MKDISVCMFSKSIRPFSYGGIETYTHELSKRLALLGCQVTVICARPNTCHKETMEIDGVKVLTVNSGSNSCFTMSSLSYSFKAVQKALNLAYRNNIDLYHGQYVYGLGYALAKKVGKTKTPFVNTIHNLILRDVQACFNNLFLQRRFSLPIGLTEILLQIPLALSEQKLICKVADRIVTVSQSSRDDCVKYCGIPATNISIIPNGVDANRFNPNISGKNIREVLKVQEAPLILYVGGFNGRKGLKYLILAAPLVIEAVNDVKFLLVGSGPYEVFLKQLVRKLGVQDSFIFLTCVSDKELPELYASADVFVMPSLWEGFGISLLEAMSTALPIVSTNVSAIPEVVIHTETGLLTEPGNYEQLAKGIITILCDKVLARNLGYNGRKRVEAYFNWDLVAEKTLALYEETLGFC